MPIPPLLVIRRGSASSNDIKLIRAAGIAVLQVKDPADVRYVEAPMPRSRAERVAMKLMADIRKGGIVLGSEVDKRLADAVMADESPPAPKPVSA